MVVVLNDAVYGHRFSRPRTSRNALSTIVERPERIKAGVLGISAAYVRLGERHCEGAFPLHPKLDAQSLPSIPFRVHKTTRRLSLLSQAVTNVHGTKWMEELKMMCDSAESKLAMGGKELQRPEMNRGTNQAPEKFHEGDLYLCSESLDAIEGALGAVCEAVDTVFGPGPSRAFVGARPPGHHCSADYPSGFCWVNNVHVGIMHAALEHGLTHAAILDFDLHHGDGSQAITWQHNTRATTAARNAAMWKKSSIGYFSLHDINSYPCEMGDEEKVKNASLCIENAHGQTVWNVHLQPWKSEQEFWQLYESKYIVLLEKVRIYLKNQAERLKLSNLPPKAAIFFSAGFDASEWESAGMQRHKVNVPTEFYARIAQDVIKLAAEEGLHVDGRVISVLEGGYSDRALCSGIFSHISGLVGDQTNDQISKIRGGLGTEMGSKIGVVPEQEPVADPEKPSLASIHTYNPTWWASSKLDDLENAVADPLLPPKQPRAAPLPTYFTPTQASTARVADPIKMRRSLSGLAQASVVSRPVTPPPPEVPWTIAVHELSKLLIPSDRQTDSCKFEDLNAEATRARRDRQSILMGVPLEPPAPEPVRPNSRMALRERKPKAVTPPLEEAGPSKTSKNRRKTLATTALSADKVSCDFMTNSVLKFVDLHAYQAAARGIPSDNNGTAPVRRASRRLSETPTAHSPTEVPQPTYGSDGSRPGTSQGARPVSGMTSRTQSADSLTVKKPRASNTRKEAGPKAPRGPKKATAAASRPTTTQKGESPAKSPAKSPARAKPAPVGTSDDIDKITSGMKKIRINLITQSQKDAKERARLEAKKSTSPPARENEVVLPSIEQASVTQTTEPALEPEIVVAAHPETREFSPIPTPPTTVPSSGFTTPIPDQSPFDGSSPAPQQVRLPSSSPAIPSVAIHSSGEPSEIFIPYQPEGPALVAVAQNEPLKWLPPNAPPSSINTPAATPSPAKHSNLFQYSGSSGIPFAPRAQPDVQPTDQTKLEPKESSSIWDVPETPRK